MAKFDTVDDVVRWLRHDVEWSDIASQDKADEAIAVLQPLMSPNVTCFACEPSRTGTVDLGPTSPPVCVKCGKPSVSGYWIDKKMTPQRQDAKEK